MVFARIGRRYRYLPILLLGLLWSAGDAAAATTFSGYTEITEDTVWTLADSPYVILDNGTVDFNGADLEIEPGVVVKFGRRSNLEIAGNLVAEGTPVQPIILTSLRNDTVLGDTNGDGSVSVPRATDDWGILVGGSASNQVMVNLSHVEMSYSRDGLLVEDGMVTMDTVRVSTATKGVEHMGGQATIQNFVAEGITQDALILYDVSASLGGLYFQSGPGYGLEAFFSETIIDGVTCENLAGSCIYAYGGGADVRNVWVKSTDVNMWEVALTFYSTTLTLNTVVVENIGDYAGLGIYDTEAVVKDVILASGLSYGLELIGFSKPTSATVENITVTGFAPGMYLSNVDLIMDGANVTDNNGGIETDMATEGDRVIVRNSIIADNSQFGVYDFSDPGYVDVRENWWGDPSGPYSAVGNPDGLGNAVVGNAQFSNWLLVPPGVPEEPEIDPLLLQYMPVLYMHPEEDYFPMNVEAFVEGSAIWDDRDLLSDTLLVPAGEGNAASLAYIATTTDTSDWYIQFSGTEAKEFDLVEAKARYRSLVSSGLATTTVYVHKMEDAYIDDAGVTHEFIVLQYWYFYAMNNWREQGGRNNHEGDWESVFVYLDKSNKIPKYVAVSAHLNDGDSRFNLIQYDSVRREWVSENLDFIDQKFINYVSLGSHAGYSNNGDDGLHRVDSLAYDVTSSLGERITSLNIKEISLLQDSWESLYAGKWGSDGVNFGEDGPQGPYYNNVSGTLRFHEPIKWAGIDTVSELVTGTQTNTLRFSAADVVMKFKELLTVGTKVSASLYREVVTFGNNIEQINFLPRFWELRTSLPNESFEVDVTVPYDKAFLSSLGVEEQWMSAYYFNKNTNLWEIVPTKVNSDTSTVTFTTNHFSRYALGSPVLTQVATSTLKVDMRPGRFNQVLDVRDYVLTLTNISATTLAGRLRLVAEDISLPGTLLATMTGTDAFANPYFDFVLVEPLLPGQLISMPLVFRLPTEVKSNVRANPQAKKPNPIEKKLDFKLKILQLF